MTIKQPHPEGDRDLPVTHVYRHPEGKGLAAHHVGDDEKPLADRLAHPGAPPDWARSSLTMHDLDLHHGTELSHVATDEDTGLLIFAWRDKQGDYRMTSLTPELADEFLEAPDAAVPDVPDATEPPAGPAEGTAELWCSQ